MLPKINLIAVLLVASFPTPTSALNKWQPVANTEGQFFTTEYQVGSQLMCVIRIREGMKLRRTHSDISIRYRFHEVTQSRDFSVQFEARDTDTIYLDGCEEVLSIVAKKVQRS